MATINPAVSEPHKPAAGDVQSEGEEEEEEEDVCPICLNELDEGEDLLVCDGCHNRLHQHCMDICESHPCGNHVTAM